MNNYRTFRSMEVIHFMEASTSGINLAIMEEAE